MTQLLSVANSQVLIVDVQEKLAPAMSELPDVLSNMEKLVRAANAIGVPITISEQYPRGLGATLARVAEACARQTPVFTKMHFSCARDPALADRLVNQDRRQIVICGLEAHVCVLQTAIDLKLRGMDPFVVVDATASRRPESKAIAMRRLAAADVELITTEMAAFEWLERAGGDQFKAVAALLR